MKKPCCVVAVAVLLAALAGCRSTSSTSGPPAPLLLHIADLPITNLLLRFEAGPAMAEAPGVSTADAKSAQKAARKASNDAKAALKTIEDKAASLSKERSLEVTRATSRLPAKLLIHDSELECNALELDTPSGISIVACSPRAPMLTMEKGGERWPAALVPAVEIRHAAETMAMSARSLEAASFAHGAILAAQTAETTSTQTVRITTVAAPVSRMGNFGPPGPSNAVLRPKPTLIPVFFATSRREAPASSRVTGKHPRYFSKDWKKSGPPTYGVCDVTMPTDLELPPGEIEGTTWHWTINLLLGNQEDSPRTDVWMHQPKIFADSNEFCLKLAADIPKRSGRSVLIGVHGFNNTFEFAGRRLAKVVHDMNYHGTPVLYSWPAGEGVSDYVRDTERANHEHEIEQFAGFLAMTIHTARQAGAREVHLVAHSMGNQLLQRAVKPVLERCGTNRLDALVLAAPDCAQNGFAEHTWPWLQQLSKRCALYVSSYDRALFGSQKLFKDGPRLGQAGTAPLVLPGLQTIDASKVGRTFLHHDYYLRITIGDLAAFLICGWEPTERVNRGFLARPSMMEAAGWYELVEKICPGCQ